MKKRNWLKVILIVLAVLILIVATIIGGGYLYLKNKLDKMQQGEKIDEKEIGIDSAVEEKLEGYRNIAFFGIDSRKIDDYNKGNRSDCIIIASLNNKTKEIKLMSVYRDTYLKINGVGLDKVTHAYSYGTERLALDTLNRNLDLNIKDYVTVNFEAVVDAVDALEGVELNIESTEEMNYLNSYIGETSKVTGKKTPKITHTGRQTVNGVQAVAYSRVRYTAGGDYKRTERMRNVIMAMAEKLKTKSIGEINKFVDVILPKVHTNISANEIISLVPSLLNAKIVESIGWPYNTKGITLDRWYGVPITLESNVKELHKNLFNEQGYEPSQTVKDISNSIIKKTGYTK